MSCDMGICYVRKIYKFLKIVFILYKILLFVKKLLAISLICWYDVYNILTFSRRSLPQVGGYNESIYQTPFGRF